MNERSTTLYRNAQATESIQVTAKANSSLHEQGQGPPFVSPCLSLISGLRTALCAYLYSPPDCMPISRERDRMLASSKGQGACAEEELAVLCATFFLSPASCCPAVHSAVPQLNRASVFVLFVCLRQDLIM